MAGLRADIDPDGLQEFSVVFTDRSLNHMSRRFQGIMREVSDILKGVYNADAVALIPGGGTYAMEAVARQIANGKKTLVVRNGWFSYRWSQIFEAGGVAREELVMKARQTGNQANAPFAPAPIDEVTAKIRSAAPDVVFAAHVETASGMILPDDYLMALAQAVHANGGLFVLDCIASGCAWIDMKAIGVDVLISAPQKGWSASPSAGLVMLNDTAREAVRAGSSTSFAMDLGKWLSIMEAYENGGHAYHATMPTDAIAGFHETMLECRDIGFETLRDAQWELGRKVRAMLTARGVPSVAAEGFAAPGVVVSYTGDPDIRNGSKFAESGVQIAAGVPLQCDEPAEYSSFRLGLFGLDKLVDVDGTVARLQAVLDRVL